MLEDVYASSDVNIVMMMFFELFYSEKFLSSQAGLEPTTFWSLVRRSNHWAIRTQMAERIGCNSMLDIFTAKR